MTYSFQQLEKISTQTVFELRPGCCRHTQPRNIEVEKIRYKCSNGSRC